MRVSISFAFICTYSQLFAFPLWFEPNQGQAQANAQFKSRNIYLNSTSVTITSDNNPLTFRLEHANAKARGEALDKLPGVSNYYLGNDPGKWRTGIPQFGRVRYHDVYPGIDLLYYGNAEGKLEYDFILQTGADPSQIKLAFNKPVRTAPNGDLLVGGFRQHRPKVYQAGHEVACDYIVAREGGSVEFALGRYHRTAPLTIDPVIEYSTYLGGNAVDVASAVAVDPTGAAYVTGYLKSPQYPSLDPFQQASGLGQDIVVAKFTPSGNALAWYTYVGGSALNNGTGIALDSSGNAYVTGWTASTDFPVKGAAQPVFGGGFENAIIVKLSPTGKLIYSTYLGGNNQERALGIAVDTTGAAFIAGFTWSADFPIKNALQPTMTGRPDAFVAKVSPAGDRFLFATYLGGSGIDYGEALTLDPSGNPIVVGLTLSPDFPIVGGLQRALGGFGIYPTNGFITKLSSVGDRILSSTYLGASGNGGLFTVTSDRTGQVYVSGRVGDGWPLKNPIQSAYGGGPGDIYVAKLSPALDSLVYGTYLGGNDNDLTGGLAVDNVGNAYVTGFTYSSDFPLKNSLQQFIGATVGFKTDAFIVKIAPNGSLLYSTLVGGHGDDRGSGIAIDPQNKVYVAGLTTSEDFPVKNPLQSTYGGAGGDIFLLRLAPDAVPASPFTLSPSTLAFRYILGGANPPAQTVSVSSASGSLPVTPASNSGWLKAASSGGATPATLTVRADPSGLKPGTYQSTIQIDPQTGVQVSLTVLAPGPTITSLSPQSVAPGSDSTVITIKGSDFDRGAVVQVGTTVVPATFIDSSDLQITLDKSSLTQAVGFSITVVNPQSAPSNAVMFTIGTPVPQISAVTNAASFATGSVAPGEIVTIFGTNLTGAVTFDNITATLVYASATQVSVTVPYSIAGPKTTVQVGSSIPVKLEVTPSAPGIFAVVPAGGNVLTLYATGCGALTKDDLPRCVAPVTATVNGEASEVLYAGIAPGLVEGANQINIQLPDDLTSGTLTIVLMAGKALGSPFSVTLP